MLKDSIFVAVLLEVIAGGCDRILNIVHQYKTGKKKALKKTSEL